MSWRYNNDNKNNNLDAQFLSLLSLLFFSVSSVVQLHGGLSKKRNAEAQSAKETEQQSLLERLKVGRKENFDPIHPILLRKYITYARKWVHPA
jgi:DNA helicase MCM8